MFCSMLMTPEFLECLAGKQADQSQLLRSASLWRINTLPGWCALRLLHWGPQRCVLYALTTALLQRRSINQTLYRCTRLGFSGRDKIFLVPSIMDSLLGAGQLSSPCLQIIRCSAELFCDLQNALSKRSWCNFRVPLGFRGGRLLPARLMTFPSECSQFIDNDCSLFESQGLK